MKHTITYMPAFTGKPRARFYLDVDHYTVVVVHDGRHRFYRCDTAADAEALVRLVEGTT